MKGHKVIDLVSDILISYVNEGILNWAVNGMDLEWARGLPSMAVGAKHVSFPRIGLDK